MTGKITISLDFEAGWGCIGDGLWRWREANGVFTELRPVLKQFVGLLDALEIECIWAVVGAMIDPPQARDLEHLKGDYAGKMRDYLQEAQSPTLDGRDLLDTVLQAKTRQAFGTHGYSHVLFTDPEQDRIALLGDLERAKAANLKAGLPYDFFVFPENRAGHFEVLSEAGIGLARMPAHNAPPPDKMPGRVGRAFALITRPISPVVEWSHPDGVRLHSGSELLNWGMTSGALKATMTRSRLYRALKHAQQGAHIHLWLHPFNLVETVGLFDFATDFLTQVAAARDAGLVTIDPLQ